MLDIVEDIPQFQLLKEIQSERPIRFERMNLSSQSITEKGGNSLRQGMSLPVKIALQIVCKILRSLYRMDIRLYNRNPRSLAVFKSILSTAENTLQVAHGLKYNEK